MEFRISGFRFGLVGTVRGTQCWLWLPSLVSMIRSLREADQPDSEIDHPLEVGSISRSNNPTHLGSQALANCEALTEMLQQVGVLINPVIHIPNLRRVIQRDRPRHIVGKTRIRM